MANPVYITMTASGVSRVVNLDTSQSPFNVSIGVQLGSTTMTSSYAVEYSFEDSQYLAAIGSTLAQTWYSDTNLTAGSSNGTSNYMFPVAAVRCTVNSISSSWVVFSVIQGGRA